MTRQPGPSVGPAATLAGRRIPPVTSLVLEVAGGATPGTREAPR